MKYWQNDPRLRAVRDRIMGLTVTLTHAEMDLKQAVKYTDPPDEDAADAALVTLADCHEGLAREQRELVRIRQVVRAEQRADAPASRPARGGEGE